MKFLFYLILPPLVLTIPFQEIKKRREDDHTDYDSDDSSDDVKVMQRPSTVDVVRYADIWFDNSYIFISQLLGLYQVLMGISLEGWFSFFINGVLFEFILAAIYIFLFILSFILLLFCFVTLVIKVISFFWSCLAATLTNAFWRPRWYFLNMCLFDTTLIYYKTALIGPLLMQELNEPKLQSKSNILGIKSKFQFSCFRL